jgi:hypothetical protein
MASALKYGDRLVKALDVNKFRAWLAKQDPNTSYEYNSNQDCLIARYLKATRVVRGVEDWGVGGTYVRIENTIRDLPDIMIRAACTRRTYGDALEVIDREMAA